MNQPITERPTIFATLRALVPRRPLTYREAERIAELQANRFRELLGIGEAQLDEAAIGSLPRIDIKRRHGMPASGLTHWHNGRWLVMLNADECVQRQRFSLCHEFKHILDHTTQQWIHPGVVPGSLDPRVERLADYFAACLLMPKRHVKRLFGQRGTVDQLAQAFGVSLAAMSIRLSQLGLIDQPPRCLRPGPRWDHFDQSYFRSKPLPQGVPA